MIIQKKYIRSLPKQVQVLKRNTQFVVGTRVSAVDLPKLQTIGFGVKPQIGDSVLPAKIGPRTTFNAEGKFIIHSDLPMETAYQTIEWTWKQFNGPHDYEEVTEFRDRPYKRYPRTKVEAPSIELTIGVTAAGERVVTSPVLVMHENEENEIIERINLFLEIFEHCELFTNNLSSLIQAPLKRLNWELLRSGNWTWESLRTSLRKSLARESRKNETVIESRFELLNSFKPDFIAIGTAGFAGYVVFAFEQPKRFVLESIYSGNATYIFKEDWSYLSKLTKTEIIENDFAERRVIHHRDWWDHMRSIKHGWKNTAKK